MREIIAAMFTEAPALIALALFLSTVALWAGIIGGAL